MSSLYDDGSATITEIDGHSLFLRIGGDFREDDLAGFFDALGKVLEEREPARILVDATYVGETPSPVRWQLLRRLRQLRNRVDRTAVYGLSPKLEALLWIFFSLGRRQDVRSFLWRHEAETWVLGSPTARLHA